MWCSCAAPLATPSLSRPPLPPFFPGKKPSPSLGALLLRSTVRVEGSGAAAPRDRPSRRRKGRGRARGCPALAAASRPVLRPGRCGAGADPGLPQRPAHGRGNGAGGKLTASRALPLRGGSGQGEPLPPACPGRGGAGAGSPRGPGRCWRGRRQLPPSEPRVGKCQSSPRTYLSGVQQGARLPSKAESRARNSPDL